MRHEQLNHVHEHPAEPILIKLDISQAESKLNLCIRKSRFVGKLGEVVTKLRYGWQPAIFWLHQFSPLAQ